MNSTYKPSHLIVKIGWITLLLMTSAVFTANAQLPMFYKNLLPSRCGRFAVELKNTACSLLYFLSDTTIPPVRIQFNENELLLEDYEYHQ